MNSFQYFTNKHLRLRRKKAGVLQTIFLTFFGVVILFSGLVMMGGSGSEERTAVTMGEVVAVEESRSSDNSQMYAPVVEYQVDGTSYRVTRSVTTSWRPDLGDTYEVSYDPNNPDNGAVSGGISFWFPAIIVSVGALVIILALVSLVLSVRRTKKIEWLKAHGHFVRGIVIDLESKRQSSRNGSSRISWYRLVVSASGLTGEVQNYLSDKFVGIPAGLIGMDFHRDVVPIGVFIDPSDPTSYYVDLSEVRDLTPERIQNIINNTDRSRGTVAGAEESVTPPKPANQQLIDYINSSRASGQTDKQIISSLLETGWQESEIKNALRG